MCVDQNLVARFSSAPLESSGCVPSERFSVYHVADKTLDTVLQQAPIHPLGRRGSCVPLLPGHHLLRQITSASRGPLGRRACRDGRPHESLYFSRRVQTWPRMPVHARETTFRQRSLRSTSSSGILFKMLLNALLGVASCIVRTRSSSVNCRQILAEATITAFCRRFQNILLSDGAKARVPGAPSFVIRVLHSVHCLHALVAPRRCGMVRRADSPLERSRTFAPIVRGQRHL